MAVANSNRVALRYGDELYTSAGVAHSPAGAWATLPSVAFETMNFTGESLEHKAETKRSENIRSDRQMSPIVQTATSAVGDTNHELSISGEQVTFMGGALAGTLAYNSGANWQATVTVTGASNMTFTGGGTNTIVMTGASFDTKFVVGQWIRVTHTTDNGTSTVPKYFSIKTVNSATTITTNENLTTENNTSGKVTGTMIRNGTVERSFYLEREYADLGSSFVRFPGAVIDTWELTFRAGDIVKSNFSWRAEKGDSAASTASNGAANAAATHNPLNATSNVSGIYEGGSALSACVLGGTIKVMNGTRERPAVARSGSCGIGYGPCDVTGTLSVYLPDLTLYNKFEGDTATSLRLLFVDSALGGLMVTVPATKYTVGRAPASSGNTDVVLELEFAANIAGSGTGQVAPGCMIQLDRFPTV